MNEFSQNLLKDTYEHFASTGERQYTVIPKNDHYFTYLFPAVRTLHEAKYIDNLSEGLSSQLGFTMASIGKMYSFSITDAGIEKARGW